MIYLDHNAGAPLCEPARRRMAAAAETPLGNPAAQHAAGRAARAILEAAREAVAAALGARAGRVFFVPSGSAGNRIALRLLARQAGAPPVILRAAGEHPSVAGACAELAAEGFAVRVSPLDPAGRVDVEAWRAAAEGAGVASACLAGGETGAVNDAARLAVIATRRGARMHGDAVQALGKVDLAFDDSELAALVVSAHKIGGPPGIGAIALAPDLEIPPLHPGAAQEGGLVPGTEPVHLAAGFHGALEALAARRAEGAALRALRDRFLAGVPALGVPFRVNGPTDGGDTGTTASVTLPGCDASRLAMALDLAGLCVGRGPACRSGTAEPSEALLALGLARAEALATLRISFGPGNGPDDADALLAALKVILVRDGVRADG